MPSESAMMSVDIFWGILMRYILLVLVLLLMQACSSNETSYDIRASRLSADGEYVDLLVSVERYKRYCPIGGHSCSNETIASDLYFVSLPLAMKTYRLPQLRERWRHIRTTTDRYGYFRNYIGEQTLLDFSSRKRLQLCHLQQSNCEPLPAWEKSDEDLTSADFLLADSGKYFIWQQQLFSLPRLDLQVDLGQRQSYRAFLKRADEALGDRQSNTSLPFTLIGDQYLLANRRYAGPEDQLLALAYDLRTEVVSEVFWQSPRSSESLAVKAAYRQKGDFYFLLNLFDYEGREKVLDRPHVYVGGSGQLFDIDDFYYGFTESLWDGDNRRFIEVAWRDGVKLSAIDFTPAASPDSPPEKIMSSVKQ